MIISHSNKFIFFKPIKVAGTSVEYALWQNCDKSLDVYTGSVLKSELSEEYNMMPANNIKTSKILNRSDGIEYLRRHGQNQLLKEVISNEDIKNIKTYEPICFEHTSPKMGLEILKNYSDYKTISISRNPFDVIVSYFWWSFSVGESIYESFNSSYEKKMKALSLIAPKREDTIPILAEKMEKFYSLPASFSNTYRKGNKDKTVLEWIADWQNEFYLHDIDFYIEYESINESYRNLLEEKDLTFFSIPRFKSSNRRSDYHFSEYFNPNLRKKVAGLFEESFQKFNYEVI